MSDLFTEQLKSLQLSERRSAAGGTHNAAEWLNLTRPSDFCRNMTALSVSASSLDNAVSDLSCPSSFSPLPRLSPSTAIPLLSLRVRRALFIIGRSALRGQPAVKDSLCLFPQAPSASSVLCFLQWRCLWGGETGFVLLLPSCSEARFPSDALL